VNAKRNIFRARAGQVLVICPSGSHTEMRAHASAVFSFPPCGRRWREAPDEGFSQQMQSLHAETDPSSAPLRSGTFSHKEGFAQLQSRDSLKHC